MLINSIDKTHSNGPNLDQAVTSVRVSSDAFIQFTCITLFSFAWPDQEKSLLNFPGLINLLII